MVYCFDIKLIFDDIVLISLWICSIITSDLVLLNWSILPLKLNGTNYVGNNIYTKKRSLCIKEVLTTVFRLYNMEP